jgi:hypothetical protein
MGKDFFDGHTAQKCLRGPALMPLLDMIARRFDQFTILDPARAGGLARPATKARIHVANGFRIQRGPPFIQRPHQVNAPAGGKILVPRLEIGWAGPEAKTTMDAGHRFGLVQKRMVRG